MNIFKHIRNKLETILTDIATENGYDFDINKITVEQPRDLTHGDMSTNCAMVLCKSAGLPPRQLAEKIIPYLEKMNEIDSVEIAGAGFINIRINAKQWIQVLDSILELGQLLW